jgi:hypothetical protein
MGNPTVTPISEAWHAGGFIVSEARGHLSREGIKLKSGANYLAGTVLGKITTGTAAATAGTNTGNGAMGAITVGVAAITGTYLLKITKAAANAGDFEVFDPQGDVCGVGTVGVAFAGGGLSFTLADGATDFVVGDSFAIAVATTAKYATYDPTATDGSQIADAILYGPVDATNYDRPGTVIIRQAEVNASELIWGANVTTAQHKASALARLAERAVVAR